MVTFSSQNNQAATQPTSSSFSRRCQEWKPFNRHKNAALVLEGLNKIPADWQLTPLQNKLPNRKGWSEEKLTHDDIHKLIDQGETKISKKGNPYRAYYSGFGLVTGNGLLAIDIDGFQAQKELDRVSGGDIPQTVSWTSGKAGRYQLLFRVPEEYRDQFEQLSRWWIDSVEDQQHPEQLDFRYKGFQSGLPPSHHPETGQYQWINSPEDVEVAMLPEWCCKLLLEAIENGEGSKPSKSNKTSKKGKPSKPEGFQVVSSVNNDWERHNKGNPCPVCGGHKNCRTNKHNGITHCRGRVSHPDFKFIGSDRHGFDMFKRKSDQQIKSPSQPQTVTNHGRNGESQKLIVLDDKIRDREIRKILSQLTLSDEHYQNLINRGFTDEQIQEVGYRTVTQWQSLTNAVNPNLAGVNKNGDGLVTPDSGLLIPVKNENGRFVGWQLRRDNPEDGNKYIWSASEKARSPRPTVKDSNQELPLAVWGKPREDGLVYLCESTGIKPYLASKQLKAPVIGASGNNFASSPNVVDRTLKELNAKKIVYLPDGGAIQNPNLLRQNQKAVDLLVNTLGYSKDNIYFAWWGQWEKSTGDIDEIEINQIKLLWDCDGFLEKSRKLADRNQQRYQNLKTFTPDKIINVPYLSPELIPYEVNQAIIAIKSGLGTNKTGATAQAIKPDEGVILIGNTNNLLIQTCERINQEIWKKDPNNQGIIHINSYINQRIAEGCKKDKAEEEIRQLVKTEGVKLACCFDSLVKWFTPSFFIDKKIILDETTAGIKHLLTSTTEVSKKLKETQNLFEYGLKNSSQVICMDGLMDDKTINYLSKLAPNKQVIKIENLHQTPVTIDWIEGVKNTDGSENEFSQNDYSFLIKQARSGLPLFFISDSQADCAKIEKELQKITINGFPLEGIRIDGETAEEEATQEFLSNPDKYIEEMRPSYVILSPSGKEGININIRNYFQLFMAVYKGVLDVDGLHQMTFRLRDPNVERMIFCKTNSQYNYEHKSLNWEENITNRKELLIADLTSKYNDINQMTAIEKDEFIQELIDINSENLHDELWAKIQAVRGYEAKNLREALRDQLEQAGHTLNPRTINLSEDSIKANKKNLKELGQEVKDEQCDRVWNRPELEPDENIESLREKSDLESRDKLKREIIKTQLSHVEEVNLDDNQIWNRDFFYKVLFQEPNLNALRRFWMLLNPEASHLLNKAKWLDYSKGETSKYQLRIDYSKVEMLRRCGIFELINSDQIFTQEHELVQNFCQNANSNEFYQLFGKRFWEGKTAPIKFIRHFTEYLGCQIDFEHQSKNGNRFYKIKTPLAKMVGGAEENWIRDAYELIALKQWEKLDRFLNHDLAESDYYDKGGKQLKEQWQASISSKIDEKRSLLGLPLVTGTPYTNKNKGSCDPIFSDEMIAEAMKQTNPYNQVRRLVNHEHCVRSFTVDLVANALGLASDFVLSCISSMTDAISLEDGLFQIDYF